MRHKDTRWSHGDILSVSQRAERDGRAGSKWNYEARVKARCTRHLSVQVCRCAGIPRRLDVDIGRPVIFVDYSVLML